MEAATDAPSESRASRQGSIRIADPAASCASREGSTRVAELAPPPVHPAKVQPEPPPPPPVPPRNNQDNKKAEPRNEPKPNPDQGAPERDYRAVSKASSVATPKARLLRRLSTMSRARAHRRHPLLRRRTASRTKVRHSPRKAGSEASLLSPRLGLRPLLIRDSHLFSCAKLGTVTYFPCHSCSVGAECGHGQSGARRHPRSSTPPDAARQQPPGRSSLMTTAARTWKSWPASASGMA